MSKTNAAFMSGVPELLVLRLLSRSEMYGYEIVRSIRITSKESIKLKEGVIYPTLHSLESKGFLKAIERTVEGRIRIYYYTTKKGLSRLETLEGDWRRVNGGINSILGST